MQLIFSSNEVWTICDINAEEVMSGQATDILINPFQIIQLNAYRIFRLLQHPHTLNKLCFTCFFNLSTKKLNQISNHSGLWLGYLGNIFRLITSYSAWHIITTVYTLYRIYLQHTTVLLQNFNLPINFFEACSMPLPEV